MDLIGWFYEVKTPTVSYEYVRKHNCPYVANLPEKDNYVYYWDGDLRTGHEVKVKSVEILRHQLKVKELDLINLHYQLDDMEKDLASLEKELSNYENDPDWRRYD